MNLLPLSYVAEYTYCPRSCYWKLVGEAPKGAEYEFIADGTAAHQSVDSGYTYTKSAKKVESSVKVFSERLGIIGKTDFIEFHKDKRIIPVELKRGKKRKNHMHEVQLALMCLCLREMFPDALINEGAIFFTEDRQKITVPFTDELLQKTEKIAKTVVEKAKRGLIPSDFPTMKDERCKGCCFWDLCYL